MFDKIQNPATGKWVNTNGPVGRKVLNNYVRQAGGALTLQDGHMNALRKLWLDGESEYEHAHTPLQLKLGLAENKKAAAQEKIAGRSKTRAITEAENEIKDIKEKMRKLEDKRRTAHPF